MNKTKIFTALLILAVIVTTFYLLMLGWYNTPSLDDYGMISDVERKGIWGWTLNVYNTWQGRFSAFWGSGITMTFFGRARNLILLTVLMLLSGWWVFERLFTGVCKKYELKIPHILIILFSILSVNVGIMSFFEPSTFYWICALSYTILIWMTALLAYSLFFYEGISMLRWFLVLISSLYISGSAEHYTPIVIMVLFVIWIYNITFTKTSNNRSEKLMLPICLLILIIGFLVMVFAPGNKVRLAAVGLKSGIAASEMSIGSILLEIVRSSFVLLMRLFSRLHYYILMFALFLGLGAFCKPSLNKITKKQVAGAFLIFMVIVVLSTTICVIGVGGLPPVRALCFMSFVVMSLCAYLGIRLADRITCQKKVIFLSITSLVILVIICSEKIIHDAPIAKSYYTYITERNIAIANKAKDKNDTSPYLCEPFGYKWENNTYSKIKNLVSGIFGMEHSFYEPQMLYMESDLSSDPNDWRNIGLKQYHQANFDIIGIEYHNEDH